MTKVACDFGGDSLKRQAPPHRNAIAEIQFIHQSGYVATVSPNLLEKIRPCHKERDSLCLRGRPQFLGVTGWDSRAGPRNPAPAPP
jgi:hypothetical protein